MKTFGRQVFMLSFLLFLVANVYCATPEQWKSRTIYQLVTDRFAKNDGNQDECPDLGNYCGGGFVGIKNNLDYIQGMGFDAIWISPIVDNYDGGYHGYWSRNLYKINSHFGTEEDFISLVEACHERDIWVMVDVVANHMGNTNEDYSQNVPFNSKFHYHDYCDITGKDFDTKNSAVVENCRLVQLADLKQENDEVRTKLLDWIRDLVNKYHIDGLRIDTVPQVPRWFWTQFNDASGVYTIGEVMNGDMGFLSSYVGPLDAVLNYPFFYTVRDTIFESKDMFNLREYYNRWGQNIEQQKLEVLGNFIDNHDNKRILSVGGNWEDKKKHFKTANALVLTSIGIPIIYYGTEQYYAGGDDPNNREILWRNMDPNSEMYRYIATINEARKREQIWNQPQIQRYADNQIFAFSRGQFLVLLTNRTYGTVQKFISYHPFKDGDEICNIFWPHSDCILVQGGFTIYLNDGEAKVYVPKKTLNKSQEL